MQYRFESCGGRPTNVEINLSLEYEFANTRLGHTLVSFDVELEARPLRFGSHTFEALLERMEVLVHYQVLDGNLLP